MMFPTLVDAAFKRAQDNGDLDDLPGAGRPIDPSALTADPFAHVYRESGAQTPLSAVREKIDNARQRLCGAPGPAERRAAQREIATLEAQLGVEMEALGRHA